MIAMTTLGAIVGALLILCALVVIHEFGHFIVARLCGMRVDRFSVGFGPPLIQKKWGETTFQISPVPLGGYVQIAGLNPTDQSEETDPNDPALYPNRPAWQRFLAVLAGPAINYLFAILVFVGLNLAIGTPTKVDGVVVNAVVKGRPAEQAGLLPGDEILFVGEQAANSKEALVSIVQQAQGRPFVWTVKRGAGTKKFQVQAVNQGLKEGWQVGVGLSDKGMRIRQPLRVALAQGLIAPVLVTKEAFSGLFRSPGKVSGPLGIIHQMKGGFSKGLVHTIEMIGLLSTALGMFNLLPIPALDGGRLVFLGIEIVTRRRVSHRAEQIVHTVGFLLLLALILLVTVKDIFGFFK